eukprot:TRINITY_DN1439_c4_g1_i1.p1 TRINITY_DN1439_c4_g1~~TRINITY_DN1439_c4_g1_i1.p1  ORF type:complete len:117 (-),score=13.13 TRINITY_DN1439_c4_g1_i1:142-492(-)
MLFVETGPEFNNRVQKILQKKEGKKKKKRGKRMGGEKKKKKKKKKDKNKLEIGGKRNGDKTLVKKNEMAINSNTQGNDTAHQQADQTRFENFSLSKITEENSHKVTYRGTPNNAVC